jgi:hypothetical protein
VGTIGSVNAGELGAIPREFELAEDPLRTTSALAYYSDVVEGGLRGVPYIMFASVLEKRVKRKREEREKEFEFVTFNWVNSLKRSMLFAFIHTFLPSFTNVLQRFLLFIRKLLFF